MQELKCDYFFQTPIFYIESPQWLESLNNLCEPYIKDSIKLTKEKIKQREKQLKSKVGDIGLSYHSTSLLNDTNFNPFKDYIHEASFDILNHMGYDLTNYGLHFTEMWVQEFAKKGGGHHEGHVHSNNHISGFYFLKCSDRTSFPQFHDPRVAKVALDLPIKNSEEVKAATSTINFKPKPGFLIFFPSYLEHQFILDAGVDPFRFIHFNLQGVKR